MKATTLLLLAAALAGCTSPEAARVRGGGPGADVGNRGPIVSLHLGANPYHDTPCRTTDVKCTGPEPDFGTSLDR
ncbi:MAG TPA: hypothetical protein VFQ38_24015 [Longimicrobiales bacterium]|nr:hypothetical protein [Longimicrobiales bacterium]